MKIEPRKPLQTVSFRLDQELKEKILAIATQNEVNEADVYRHIIKVFFSGNRTQKEYDINSKRV